MPHVCVDEHPSGVAGKAGNGLFAKRRVHRVWPWPVSFKQEGTLLPVHLRGLFLPTHTTSEAAEHPMEPDALAYIKTSEDEELSTIGVRSEEHAEPERLSATDLLKLAAAVIQRHFPNSSIGSLMLATVAMIESSGDRLAYRWEKHLGEASVGERKYLCLLLRFNPRCCQSMSLGLTIEAVDHLLAVCPITFFGHRPHRESNL